MNAEPDDLPAVQILQQGHGWTDLGAHPKWMLNGASAPTCFVAGNVGTKQDTALVDPHLCCLVRAFETSPEDAFPVHRPIKLDVARQAEELLSTRHGRRSTPREPGQRA